MAESLSDMKKVLNSVFSMRMGGREENWRREGGRKYREKGKVERSL